MRVEINAENAIANFDMLWTETVKANHLINELWQNLLMHGHEKPLTPEFVNSLLDLIVPAQLSCRRSTQIALECRKMIADKISECNSPAQKGISHNE
jgi:hypothetical protein